MGQPNDTSPEAQQVLVECLRQMPFERRWRQMGEIYHTARTLHATGYAARHPQATSTEIQADWAMRTLGPKLVQAVQGANDVVHE